MRRLAKPKISLALIFAVRVKCVHATVGFELKQELRWWAEATEEEEPVVCSSASGGVVCVEEALLER